MLNLDKISSLEVFIDDMPLMQLDHLAVMGIVKDVTNLNVNGKWFNYAVVDLDVLKAKSKEKEFGIRWYI